MADYYSQFSELLDVSPDEVKWFTEQLQYVYVYDGVEYSQDEIPQELRKRRADWEGYRFFRPALDPDYYGRKFEYRFFGDKPGEYQLWLYAEEYGDPEAVGLLMQTFLRRFRPDASWLMAYANTCSRPRPRAFGGGVMLVTPEKIEFRTTDDLAAELQQQESGQ